MKNSSEKNKFINNYINRLNEQYRTGRAREHSYRGSLEFLIKSLLPNDGFSITNEPARIECGAPDYVISFDNIPIAFIEAKDIGDSDLDGVNKNREQFNRYKDALHSIIFTDYLDFHLYQNGNFVESVRIGEIIAGGGSIS